MNGESLLSPMILRFLMTEPTVEMPSRTLKAVGTLAGQMVPEGTSSIIYANRDPMTNVMLEECVNFASQLL